MEETTLILEKLPDPDCPRCNGVGSRYVPPLQEQLTEKEAGTRNHITKRVCDCQLVKGV